MRKSMDVLGWVQHRGGGEGADGCVVAPCLEWVSYVGYEGAQSTNGEGIAVHSVNINHEGGGVGKQVTMLT